MFTLERREILGYRREPVPHTYYRQQEATTHLALVFPGGGVNCQHPTLYYPTRELLARGADALLIDYSLRPAFSTYSEEEIMACVLADSLAAFQAACGHDYGFEPIIHTPELLEAVRDDWRTLRPFVEWVCAVE